MSNFAHTFSTSDADLLAAFVHDCDAGAFSQLAARHGGMVLAVCRSVLGNTPDAEDAAQAVFLTLAQKAPSHRVHGSLAGWLHRVAWYVAARSARARAIRRLHEQEAARMNMECPPSPAADGDPIPLDLLHAGLADLPEKYRVPLLLHHLEGRTQEETAALLGCGVSAVAMRLSRGREMLRQRLARRGLAPTTLGLVGALSSQVHGQVSAGFVAGTAKAATAILAGHVTATGLSASALALKQGAIHMLFWSKIKSVAAAIVVMLLVGGAGALVARQALASAQTAPQPGMTGTISQVGANSILLRTSSQYLTVTFNTATIVKVDGNVATAGDLKVGMSAIVFGPTTGPATEIRAYSPKPTTTPPPPAVQPNVAGTITQVGAASITIQTTAAPVVVPFDATTVINVGGKAATAADLKVGMRAYAIVPTGKPATDIRAYVPATTSQPATPPAQPSVSGTISQIGPGTTITLRTGTQYVTVTTNAATTVQVDGKAATFDGLKLNMSAIAVGPTGGPALQIRAYTPKPTSQPTTAPPPAAQPNVAGTITQIGAGSITVQTTATQTVVVPFDATTAINVGGKTATAADLKVGMRAYAIVPTGKPATDIRAYVPATTTTATAPASVKQTITGAATALPAYNPAKMDPAIANATVTVTINGTVTVYYVYGWAGIICAQNNGKTVEVTGTVGKTTAGQITITAASVNVKVIIVQ